MLRMLVGGLALVLAVACGGGGSPTAPDRNIVFIPDGRAPSNAISLVQVDPSSEILTLEVRATEVENVDVFRFNILWPPDLLQWEGREEGDLIHHHDGQTIAFVGVFNLFWVSRSPVSGSGIVLTIRLRKVKEGRGRIEFDPEYRQLVADSGEEIPGVTWLGGEVVIE